MLDLLSSSDIDRFWSKIEIKTETECWPWTARARNSVGYGVLKHKSGKNIIASRISCFLAHGSPPHTSAKSLHSCDNPSCCNPLHLRWGSSQDNVNDAKSRNRHVNPPDTRSNPEWNAKRLASMPKGERVHNQSITEELARKIFRLHMEHFNVTQISNAIGKPKHVVADVCRGRSWQHLSGAPSLEELKQGGVRRGFNQFS